MITQAILVVDHAQFPKSIGCVYKKVFFSSNINSTFAHHRTFEKKGRNPPPQRNVIYFSLFLCILFWYFIWNAKVCDIKQHSLKFTPVNYPHAISLIKKKRQKIYYQFYFLSSLETQ